MTVETMSLLFSSSSGLIVPMFTTEPSGNPESVSFGKVTEPTALFVWSMIGNVLMTEEGGEIEGTGKEATTRAVLVSGGNNVKTAEGLPDAFPETVIEEEMDLDGDAFSDGVGDSCSEETAWEIDPFEVGEEVSEGDSGLCENSDEKDSVANSEGDSEMNGESVADADEVPVSEVEREVVTDTDPE